jgi:hypothetical protein
MNFFPDHFQINGKSQQQIYLDSATSIYDGRIGETILLRLLNIGYGLNKYIFPPGLNPNIITSDGRPLPSVISKDTILVYPGERFSVLISPQSLMTDSVKLEYRNLYQEQLWGTELIPINIDGYLSVKDEIDKTPVFYPNPAENSVLINREDINSVFVQTLIGEKVQISMREDKTIDISILKPGAYILVIETKSGEILSEVLIKK